MKRRLSHILTFDYKWCQDIGLMWIKVLYSSYVILVLSVYMDYFIYLLYYPPNILLNRNQSKDYMTTGVAEKHRSNMNAKVRRF